MLTVSAKHLPEIGVAVLLARSPPVAKGVMAWASKTARAVNRTSAGALSALLLIALITMTAHAGRAATTVIQTVLVTKTQTFRGGEGTLDFPGGVPQCGANTPAVSTLTLPAATLAPASADTQLGWTPDGEQSGAYTITVENPSGVAVATWSIGANSKTQVVYSAAGQPAGAWSFVESGLHSSSCSNASLSLTTGTATGKASWYQPGP